MKYFKDLYYFIYMMLILFLTIVLAFIGGLFCGLFGKLDIFYEKCLGPYFIKMGKATGNIMPKVKQQIDFKEAMREKERL